MLQYLKNQIGTKLKLWQNANKQIVTKLKIWNCDKTLISRKLEKKSNSNIPQKSSCGKTPLKMSQNSLKLWQTKKTKFLQNSKTKIGTTQKLKLWQNWNCERTQKLKLW